MKPPTRALLFTCAVGSAAMACWGWAAAGCLGEGGTAAGPYGPRTNPGGEYPGTVANYGATPASSALPCQYVAEGTPCSRSAPVCEFGLDDLVECDTLATCTDGLWLLAGPDAGDPLCVRSPAACPSSVDSFVGQETPCATPNLVCIYPGFLCECEPSAARPGASAGWKCATRAPGAANRAGNPGNFSCPQPRPRLGTPCSIEGLVCDYGTCMVQGANRDVCSGGFWTEEIINCNCPSKLPERGEACAQGGNLGPIPLPCEFGSSTLQECNTLAACSSGQWQVTPPDASSPCKAAPASACPGAGQPIQGMPCSSPGLDCDYGDMRCECAAGPKARSETTWRCADPLLAGLGCGKRPLLGTPCDQEGLQCDYGACEIRGGSGVYCGAGLWMASAGNCPELPFGPFEPFDDCASPFANCCPASVPEAGRLEPPPPPPPSAGSSGQPPPPPPPLGAPACVTQLTCEYGSSNVASCNTIATCNTVWMVTGPDAGDPGCTAAPSTQCPASFAAVPRGAGCDGGAAFCDYPEGRCTCTAATSGTVWMCQDPAPGCPTPRPRLGASCNQEGLVCGYEPCFDGGVNVEMCRQGWWVTRLLGCSDAGR